MKIIILMICSAATLIMLPAAFASNFVNNANYNRIRNMNSNSNSFTTIISNSSGYHRGQVILSAANLSQPHILKVETSATQLSGKIIVNETVVQNLSSNKTEIDLSPYLSLGEHKVEISANYAPAPSSIKVEFNAPNSSITNETNGKGVFNYLLDITVR
ncbi:hypothetical protein Riv7116_6830 [Rivularia sp. PCC 7116]|uniref:hypothetical protein n=1 Tax=Rivularia sp. PCC 7116 TaxID=373994 RepID=UPI00029F3D1E|nr:hypothetical protein [Rivularia sp. PCC 7116]AFY59146.1 hypothetical protein Riv7116_6830 [Rivularia sp. PCC 7116]